MPTLRVNRPFGNNLAAGRMGAWLAGALALLALAAMPHEADAHALGPGFQTTNAQIQALSLSSTPRCPALGLTPGIGLACPQADGLLALYSDAGELIGLSHGPDVALYTHTLQEYRIREEMSDSWTDYGPGGRDPICVDPATSTNYGHLVYARPQDGKDRYASHLPTIQEYMRFVNQRLYRESEWVGTGVLTEYRMACTGTQLDVQEVVLPYNVTDFGTLNIMGAFSTMLNTPGVQYWVYFDSYSFYFDEFGNPRNSTIYQNYTPSYLCQCGGWGTISNDPSPGLGNAVNTGTGIGITYDGTPNTMMHENGHNMGAVLASVPNGNGNGHCLDGIDVMCRTTVGNPSSTECTDADHYDCGYDDYFHPGPPLASTWLGSHWNVGHQNLFLHYTSGPVQPLTAIDDYYVATVELGVHNFSVAKNDRNPFLRPVQVTSITTAPTKGTATIASDGLHILYDPVDSMIGLDRFNYTIANNIGEADVAEITIDLNHFPTPINLQYTIPQGGSVTIPLTWRCDVAPMATDPDPPGDISILALPPTTAPGPGSPAAVISISETWFPCDSSWFGTNQTLSFGPFHGTAQVKTIVFDHHTRRDGKQIQGNCCKSNTQHGYVNITVYPVPPVNSIGGSSFSGSETVFAVEDTAFDFVASASLSASDENSATGITGTLSIPAGHGSLFASGTGITGSGTNGISFSGSLTQWNQVLGTLSFTPPFNACGTQYADLTMTTSDGILPDTDSISIQVLCVDDQPVGENDPIMGCFDAITHTPLTIPSPGILANDGDVDGDALMAAPDSTPLEGLDLEVDGSFAFTAPSPGMHVFHYLLGDGTGPLVGPYSVCIHATDNRLPVALYSFTPSAAAGQGLSFIDMSYDDDGIIVSWLWDFGDGTVTTQVSPFHVFARPGTYRVQLTVTDDRGYTNRHSRDIVIEYSDASRQATEPAPESAVGMKKTPAALMGPGTSSSRVQREVRDLAKPNHAPTASAGDAQTVPECRWTLLDGSASMDPDGDLLTFEWVQVAGEPVAIRNATSRTASFIAPAYGADPRLMFELVVQDGKALAADTVTVFVTPQSIEQSSAASEAPVKDVQLASSGSMQWSPIPWLVGLFLVVLIVGLIATRKRRSQ